MIINYTKILSVVFLLNIFRIYPAFLPGSIGIFFGGRLIDIFIVTILALILLNKFEKVNFKDFSLLLGIPFFVLSFLYGLSLFSGISMGYEFQTFSLVEFFRYSITGVIGLVYLTFGGFIKNSFINKFWIYAILLNLLFNIFLLVVPGFQSVADILISSKTKLSIIDSGNLTSSYVLRSSGLFINPNWAGLFYNIALVYFIFSPKEIIKTNNIYRFALIFITIICIFMTGSRTAIVLFLAVLSIYLIIKFKIWFFIFLIFGYFIVAAITLDPSSWNFLPIHYRNLLNAIFVYGDLSAITSFDDRLSLWKYIYENYILLRPGLGFGVTNSIGIADNQYIWMLASYGYVGSSIVFLYFGFLLTNVFVLRVSDSSDIFFKRFIYITFILFLIAGLTGQFFNVTQLIFLWFMIFGIYLSKVRLGHKN